MIPLPENKELVGNASAPQLGIGWLPNSKDKQWMLEQVHKEQEAIHQAMREQVSDCKRWRMALEASKDLVPDN
jgi:hypothetical protein